MHHRFRVRDLFYCALVVLAPVALVVGAVVAMRLGRPILFRHERPGEGARPFHLVKFRTMTDARDDDGNLRPDHERLTRTGRLLRSTSLDELPELVNVLRGDMSLVGPRPLLMCYLDRYSAGQARRHEVKPGLTGWAQVNGRNSVDWQSRFDLDVWYVDNVSFGLDLRILARTIAAVVRREGINEPGRATMTEFTGNGSSSAHAELGAPLSRPHRETVRSA